MVGEVWWWKGRLLQGRWQWAEEEVFEIDLELAGVNQAKKRR